MKLIILRLTQMLEPLNISGVYIKEMFVQALFRSGMLFWKVDVNYRYANQSKYWNENIFRCIINKGAKTEKKTFKYTF